MTDEPDEIPAEVPFEINLQYMGHVHLADVCEIERQSYLSDQWDAARFREYLKQKHCMGIVAQVRGVICGFCVFETTQDSTLILNLAVARDWRRQGIGRAIVEKIKNSLHQGRKTIITGVSEHSLDGQFFLKAIGFRYVKTLPNHTDDEEAYLFEYEPSEV